MLLAPLTPRSLRSPALVAALVALACGRADETDRAATPAVTPQVEAKAPAEHEAASKGKGKRGALMSTGERAPALASKAPDFELSALDGATFELAKARAAGPVVLVFYRGHW
ncbi:MAG: hypothetical protein R3A51_04730 [Nannocystaceae bacterium]